MNTITPAFKILKSGDNALAIDGQFPRLGERIAIGIGDVEAATIEPNDGQTILFNESLYVLPPPVCAASRPLQAYEIATLACYSTQPFKGSE